MSKEKDIVKEINNKEKEEINNLKELQKEKEKDLNIIIDKEEQSLIEKQKKELNDLIENFDIKIRPKISAYYLDLKVREYFLVKQERYIEAQEKKEKAQKQYMEDNKFIDGEKKLQLWKKIEELNEKHRIELINFNKNKNKRIYLLKKEENEKQKEINDKYKNEKESEVIKSTINNIIKKYKNRKDKIDNNNSKRNKNNPFE